MAAPSCFKSRIIFITHSLLRASREAVGSSNSRRRGLVIRALAMVQPLFLTAAECGGNCPRVGESSHFLQVFCGPFPGGLGGDSTGGLGIGEDVDGRKHVG